MLESDQCHLLPPFSRAFDQIVHFLAIVAEIGEVVTRVEQGHLGSLHCRLGGPRQ